MLSNDPFDAATQAGEQPDLNTVYGLVEVNASFVKLVKGQGKTPFNPDIDPVDQRRTEVQIVINPIDAMNLSMLIERTPIAESREWSGIIWPSLRDNCGFKNARDLHGKWAKVELVKTGEKYTDKRGIERERSSLKFLAVFNTAAECTAAFYADRGAPESEPAMGVPMGAAAPATNGNGNGNAAERDTAYQFLSVLVKQAGGDKGKLAGLIAQMPMISKYFTADSPEVVSLMGAR